MVRSVLRRCFCLAYLSQQKWIFLQLFDYYLGLESCLEFRRFKRFNLIHAKLSEFCLNDIFKFLKMCICYESWLQVLFVIDIEVVLSLPLPHSFILQDPLEILFADHANDFFLCRHICLHRLLWQRVCLNSEWNLFNSNVLHTDLFLDVFYAWVAIFPFVFKRFHAIVA